MLQGLDRPHRLAYVLGELIDLSGRKQRNPRDLPSLFRKQRQQARTAIEAFSRTYCSFVSDSTDCVYRRVPAALRLGPCGRRRLSLADEGQICPSA